jgi:uncharacterized protein YbjT (DUF2867 family)
MGTSKTIAVVGATGTQGGSVARAILNDRGAAFRVRALTRNPHSERAQTLARLGADVVQADADDISSLKKAFAGAHGAYCMTDFWGHGDPDLEREQGLAIAEAVRCAGVQHAIWSTLEDTRRFVPLSDSRMPTLHGKYKVPHFDAKGEVDDAFQRLGVPTTFFLTSFYWENFLNFPGMGLHKDAGGALTLTMPLGRSRLPGIAAEDIGRCALGIFKETCSIGQRIGIAGGHLTGEQMAASMTRALSRPVRYVDVDPAVYRTWNFPGAAELSNMIQFKRDFEEPFCSVRSIERSRQLNPSLQTFDNWLAIHAREFRL